MAQSIQQPLEGIVTRYEGIWRPDWEIAHIAVHVSRARKLRRIAFIGLGLLIVFVTGLVGPIETGYVFGLLTLVAAAPSTERWAPRFPPGSDIGLGEQGGPIQFEGIVSAPGYFGHKGIMRRTVEIVTILRYNEAEQ